MYFIFQSEFSVLINSFIFESFSFDHGQVLELMPGIRRRAGISGREVKLQLLPSSCHHHHHQHYTTTIIIIIIIIILIIIIIITITMIIMITLIITIIVIIMYLCTYLPSESMICSF